MIVEEARLEAVIRIRGWMKEAEDSRRGKIGGCDQNQRMDEGSRG
jgi:hypothetical protein